MRKFIGILYVILLLTSCLNDVDFDQVDDIEIYTDHNASLVYFDLDANDFLDDLNNEVVEISDTVSIPVFAGPYNENFLIQADFLFNITNTFTRSITLQYEFLDENNNSVYQVESINSTPSNFNEEYIRIIPETEISSVLTTEKIVINISLGTGVPLDPALGYQFSVESAVLLHYKVTAKDE